MDKLDDFNDLDDLDERARLALYRQTVWFGRASLNGRYYYSLRASEFGEVFGENGINGADASDHLGDLLSGHKAVLDVGDGPFSEML